MDITAAPPSLVIVGGGPCALAIVLRLAREAGDCSCTPPGSEARRRARELLAHMVVVDATGCGFLTLWRRKLASQGVNALRSPSFVHPHASRVLDDALARFGSDSGRQREFVPLAPRTGGASTWQAPGAQLFEDFCASALDEVYATCPELCDRILHGSVIDIHPLISGEFELHCQLAECNGGDLCVFRTRRVVLAVGGGSAVWPDWAVRAKSGAIPGRLLHASQLAASHSAMPILANRTCRDPVCRGNAPTGRRTSSPAPQARSDEWKAVRAGTAVAALARRLQRASWIPHLLAALPACSGAAQQTVTNDCARPSGRGRLLVIGGGLSAAQLTCEAVRLGWAHVTLVARRRLVVRPFDIDEAWMRRHLSVELNTCEAEFFSAGLADRRTLLRKARPGGSVTCESLSRLEELRKRGQLELCEEASVLEARWTTVQPASRTDGDAELVGGVLTEGAWDVHFRCDGSTGLGRTRACVVDAIWLATGACLDVAAVPVLRSLLQAQPQPTHGGLPELTPALRWNETTPLYISGALAALQLGPDAFNLAGAGQGASRIVSDLLQDGSSLCGVAVGGTSDSEIRARFS